MNKTIDINPALFSVGGLSRTKKNREKKLKPIKIPLISPNVLKNKLLKRIKEHKKKENEPLDNKEKKLDENNIFSYNDEFNDSINYLQTLSKEKKIKDNERERNLQKQELERKTIKNYHSLSSGDSYYHVNLELPEELKENYKFPNYKNCNFVDCYLCYNNVCIFCSNYDTKKENFICHKCNKYKNPILLKTKKQRISLIKNFFKTKFSVYAYAHFPIKPIKCACAYFRHRENALAYNPPMVTVI
jgi:hypothetical protein